MNLTLEVSGEKRGWAHIFCHVLVARDKHDLFVGNSGCCERARYGSYLLSPKQTLFLTLSFGSSVVAFLFQTCESCGDFANTLLHLDPLGQVHTCNEARVLLVVAANFRGAGGWIGMMYFHPFHESTRPSCPKRPRGSSCEEKCMVGCRGQ